MFFGAAVIAALLSASYAEAFFILSQPILLTTRQDPIVSPGKVAGHVHTIAGGSQFSDDIPGYETSITSKCTTASVTVDKSNYWTPQLYHFNQDKKTFTMVPVQYMNTYYLSRPETGEYVNAFPKGLRMLVGNPFRRTYNPNNFEDKAISFVCLDGKDHGGDPAWGQIPGFHQLACPLRRAQVIFPSCWDGVNLDSTDHKSHMSFPTRTEEFGPCPSSHPVRVPTLFYEVIYDTSKFDYVDEDSFFFSQGDNTGYGFHGDAILSWDSDSAGNSVLQAALDGCNANNGVGGVLENCPPFVPFLDSRGANACTPENPLVNEDIGDGHDISALPGNNPVTIKGRTYVSTAEPIPVGGAPVEVTSEAPYTSSASVIPAPASTTTSIKSPVKKAAAKSNPSDWNDYSCRTDIKQNGRTLIGYTFSSDDMTPDLCIKECIIHGFKIAGIEYGRECYCGNVFVNGGGAVRPASECAMPCAGSPSSYCGAADRLSTFTIETTTMGKKRAVF